MIFHHFALVLGALGALLSCYGVADGAIQRRPALVAASLFAFTICLVTVSLAITVLYARSAP